MQGREAVRGGGVMTLRRAQDAGGDAELIREEGSRKNRECRVCDIRGRVRVHGLVIRGGQ